MKPKISACIIAFNEENIIGDCIRSLDFVDEVILIDSGSNDRTVEIAESLNAKVYFHFFEGHIEQKNYSLTLAKNDWIISLDADERVSDKLKEKIIDTFNKGPEFDGYKFPRKSFYIDKWINHSGWYPDRKLRLFKKSMAKWGGTNPHDRIILQGRIGFIEEDLLHYSFSSLKSHINTINNFSAIMARNLYKEGKTRFLVFKLIFKPVWKIIEMYILQRGFLDGLHGFIIAVFSSFAVFARYAKLYELMKKGYDGKYKED